MFTKLIKIMKMKNIKLWNLFIIFGIINLVIVECIIRHQHYTKEDILQKREEVREMFNYAYNGYLKYASGYDELRPLTCDGVNTWGSYSLTLIDALDTLVVMGNHSEFRRVVDYLINTSNFDADINVSVFETNIRIVGGLLSAHLFSRRAGIDLEPGWPCNGPLLRMAEDVARRLLPAFNTKTGMPYGTVNLRYGVPAGETPITCTAGVGTFLVEFGALSRLTGDPIYEEVALNAVYSLWEHRSPIGLFGNHIDVQTGRWTAQDSGIGAGVDSYFEYLVKGAIMLNRPDLLRMFQESRDAIDRYLKKEDWYVWVSMTKGQVTLPVFQSLEAFWPGVLALIGDTEPAIKTFNKYHSVWKQYGFLPEFYNIPNLEATRETYPLRPELVESAMLLHRATKDPFFLEVGDDILTSIQHSARTNCGYSTIRNIRNHERENRMESFFLAETTKYLYLLFDSENFIHNDGSHGVIFDTPNGECVIEAGNYIFNTEAHPIDPSALHCCAQRTESFSDFNFNDFRGESLDAQQRKFLLKQKEKEKFGCPEIQPRNANITIDLEFEIIEDLNFENLTTSEKFGKLVRQEVKIDSKLFDQMQLEIRDIIDTALSLRDQKENYGAEFGSITESLKTVMRQIEIKDHVMQDNNPLFNITTMLKLDNSKKKNLYELYLVKLKSKLNLDVINELEIYKKANPELKLELNDLLNLVTKIFKDKSSFGRNGKFQGQLIEPSGEEKEYNDNPEILGNNFDNIKSIDNQEPASLTDDRENLNKNQNSLANPSHKQKLATSNDDRKQLRVTEDQLNQENIAKDNLTLDLVKILYKIEQIYEQSLKNSTEIYEFILQYIGNPEKEQSKAALEMLKMLKTIEYQPQFDSSDNSPKDIKLNSELFEELVQILEFKQKISDTFKKLEVLKEDLREKEPTDLKSRDTNDDDIIVLNNKTDDETGFGTIEPISEKQFQDSNRSDDLVKNFADSKKSEIFEEKSSAPTQQQQPIPPNLKSYLDESENSSILADFVQSLLKSTLPVKQKFDPQILLEKIRQNGSYMNYDADWEIFSCKAPNFMQKMHVNGLL